MKVLILIAAFLAVASSQIDYDKEEMEYHQRLGTQFKEHLFPFTKRLALEANYYSKGHFIISAHSIWYILGDSLTSEERKYLYLPDEQSLREKFNGLSFRIEGFGDSISFYRSRAIAVDETVDIDQNWNTFDNVPGIMPSYLRSVRFNKPFGKVQKYVTIFQPNIPQSNHTVLLDHLIVDGLWNSGFSDRATKKGSFCNEQGEKIAEVEYLRMKGRVRVAHFPDNVKVLEVPVGSEGKHTMLFAVGGKVETMIERIFSGDIFSDLKLTESPIDVAIPKLWMSSGMDMGPIFKNIRDSPEFFNPAVTSAMDTPASQGYFQIVTVNITDSVGRNESSDPKGASNEDTYFASIEQNGFIVNRPFLFAMFVPLYETDIKVPIFTGVYSSPGERGQQRVFDEI